MTHSDPDTGCLLDERGGCIDPRHCEHKPQVLRASAPLDVERLARALHVNVGDRFDYENCPQTLDGWHRKTAEVIAAEYARLTAEGEKP